MYKKTVKNLKSTEKLKGFDGPQIASLPRTFKLHGYDPSSLDIARWLKIASRLCEKKPKEGETNTYVVLTEWDISPNDLQSERFPASEEIFIQINDNLWSLQESLGKLTNDQKTIYIKGPVGIGKTYSLMYWVWISRCELNVNYRILYINNPKKLFESWIDYIFGEMIYAFANDWKTLEKEDEFFKFLSIVEDTELPFGESSTAESMIEFLNEKYQEIKNSSNPVEELNLLLSQFITYFHLKGILVLIVFDQFSYLFKEQASNKVSQVKTLRNLFDKSILGVSHDLGKMASSTMGKEIAIYLNSPWSIREGLRYLLANHFDTTILFKDEIIEEDLKSDPLMWKIFEQTNFYPLDLQVFSDIRKKFDIKEFKEDESKKDEIKEEISIDELFSKYYDEREQYILNMHQDWLHHKPQVQEDKFRNFKFQLLMHLHPKQGDLNISLIDPNLIYRNKNNEWTFANETTRKVLYSFYSNQKNFWKHVEPDLYQKREDISNILTKSLVGHSAYGDFLERLVSTTMELVAYRKKKWSLTCYDVNAKEVMVSFGVLERLTRFQDNELIGGGI